MPSYMWGEAARHTVYVLNRLPTRALNGKTPYEAWSGKRPNLEHIQIFGCVANMKVPAVHTKNLDDRGKLVVYLGREPGTKGSRMYDPKTGSLHVSRDVVCKEKSFWTWNQEEESGVSFPR